MTRSRRPALRRLLLLAVVGLGGVAAAAYRRRRLDRSGAEFQARYGPT